MSAAGGLGSIATSFRTPEQVRAEIGRVRELTDRPFAVNHTRRPFSEEALEVTLAERPAVVSLAVGSPRDLAERVHAIGALFMVQVTTVAQAKEAVEGGADAVIAQGGEGGGFSGSLGTLALVPQVVDAVSPVPVVAAGGIFDGRGLAAALALGAAGVNLGTRFLAAEEAGISRSWKDAILAADAEDTVKLTAGEGILPPISEGGWETLPRSLRTPFVDRVLAAGPADAGALGDELRRAMDDGRAHELIPLTGESAGGISEVLGAAEIVRRLVADAESALERASRGR